MVFRFYHAKRTSPAHRASLLQRRTASAKQSVLPPARRISSFKLRFPSLLLPGFGHRLQNKFFLCNPAACISFQAFLPKSCILSMRLFLPSEKPAAYISVLGFAFKIQPLY